MANDNPSLFCQKCRTPLHLDPSLEQLNPAAFKLLTTSTVSPEQQTARKSPRQNRPTYPSARRDDYQHALQDARNPTFKRSIPSTRFSQHGAHPAMSFIDVHMSDSMVAQPNNSSTPQKNGDEQEGTGGGRRPSIVSASTPGAKLADNMETANIMFQILSARSDIDHPICKECTEMLVDGLQKRLGTATRERDAYVDYLRRANTDVPSEEERQQALTALKSAQKKETAAMSELEKLEAEKASLDAELTVLEVESRELDRTEEEFWRERNAFSDKLTAFQNERDALNYRHAHDSQVLTQLERRSVYNDAFNITHDNHGFATINGLRLGRLSHPVVEWSEINAAWGQACLLLATLAERLGYKFQGYELHPMGSTSTVSKLETKPTSNSNNSLATTTRQSFPLYASSEFPLGLNFLQRRLDNGMVAFLECLRQLGEFVEASPSPSSTQAGATQGGLGSMKMPYEIKKDKIHDQSIKLSLNKDESWTKACKYTLTCCKYLLAHANNVETHALRRRG